MRKCFVKCCRFQDLYLYILFYRDEVNSIKTKVQGKCQETDKKIDKYVIIPTKYIINKTKMYMFWKYKLNIFFVLFIASTNI